MHRGCARRSRTPSSRHGSARPQASRAGWTIATPSRSSSAAEVGRRVDLGRAPASASSSSTSAPSRAASLGTSRSSSTCQRLGGDVELAGALEARSRCRSARRSSSMPSRFSRPSRLSVGHLVGPALSAVGQAVGQAGGAEPAVAPGRRPAAARGPPAARRRGRVALLGQQRGPQPGVAAADDDAGRRGRRPTSAGSASGRRVGRARTARVGVGAAAEPAGAARRSWAALRRSGRRAPAAATSWPTTTSRTAMHEHQPCR